MARLELPSPAADNPHYIPPLPGEDVDHDDQHTEVNDRLNGHSAIYPRVNRVLQNEAEVRFTYGPTFTFGDMDEPPADGVHATDLGLEVWPHHYCDSGTQYLMVPGEARGSYRLIDWSWNWDLDPDPKTKPLLNWYAGDDPVVLRWQYRWLREAGATGVVMVPNGVTLGFSRDEWDSVGEKDGWIKVAIPEAIRNGLGWMTWVRCVGDEGDSGDQADIDASFIEIIATAAEYGGHTVYRENGKSYMPIWVWDPERMRAVYDTYGGGQAATVAMLKARAQDVRDAGIADGIMLVCHNGGDGATNFGELDGGILADPDTRDPSLFDNGVIVMTGNYGERYANDADYGDYPTYARTVEFPTSHTHIPTVCTAALSRGGHPSNWPLAGSNPDDFGLALSRAIDSIEVNGQRPILTIYSLGEWLEGGEGLCPTEGWGFGYLAAMARARKRVPSHILPNPVVIPATLLDPLSGSTVQQIGNYMGRRFRPDQTDQCTAEWRKPDGWTHVDVWFWWGNEGPSSDTVRWQVAMDAVGPAGDLTANGPSALNDGAAPAPNVLQLTKVASNLELNKVGPQNCRAIRLGTADPHTENVVLLSIWICDATKQR